MGRDRLGDPFLHAPENRKTTPAPPPARQHFSADSLTADGPTANHSTANRLLADHFSPVNHCISRHLSGDRQLTALFCYTYEKAKNEAPCLHTHTKKRGRGVGDEEKQITNRPGSHRNWLRVTSHRFPSGSHRLPAHSPTRPKYRSSQSSTAATNCGRRSVTSCGVSSTRCCLSAAGVPSIANIGSWAVSTGNV